MLFCAPDPCYFEHLTHAILHTISILHYSDYTIIYRRHFRQSVVNIAGSGRLAFYTFCALELSIIIKHYNYVLQIVSCIRFLMNNK